MKIHVFIAHMGIGGSERVCVNLANEWADRGHEVHIVVLNLDNDINTENLRASVEVHELGVSRLRYAPFAIFRYICRNKPPFMLIFGNEMAIILSKLRKLGLVKTPLVVRILNNVNISLSKEDNVSPAVEEYLKKAQSELSGMEHLVAQCNAMGEQLLERNIAKADKLSVIYNPVSEDLLKKVASLRNETYGLHNTGEASSKEIAFIGRIDPQKNPIHLIEAFKLVHDAMPNVSLRIVGEGNLSEQVRKLVKDKELTEFVSFDGIRRDMENVYAKADLVVLTSDYEGMPNCLIESIGCGIPVVSYDCPLGPSEIVIDGVNGYLVKLHDVREMSKKIIEALNKNWNRDEIVASCDKFRVTRAASMYEEIFNKING